MSADTYLVIVCDGPPRGEPCGAETHSPTRVTTHAELRSLRRMDGWRTRRHPEGGPLLDLCPDCARRRPMTRGSAAMAAAHLACGMWLAHAATVSAQHRAWPAAALMATAALVAATAAIREAAAVRPVVLVALPAEDQAALAVDDGLAQLYTACCDEGFTTRGARHRSTCTGRTAA